MNINHLIAFIKVIQMKSFNAAAKQLGVTQPAISMRVQTLEDYFGKKLIMRMSDGVQLTHAGELAYEKIQAILYQWEQLEVTLKGNKTSGTIKLGASTIPSEYLLPKLLGTFKRTYPEIQVNTFVSGSHNVITWLMDGTVDIIITGKQQPNAHVTSRKLYEDELVIIVPPTLEKIETYTDITHFSHVEWILREPSSNTRKVFEQFLKKEKLLDKIQVTGQMGSNEAVIGAVEAGLGVSVVSSLAAKRAAAYGRVQVIDSDVFAITRPFFLATLKESMKHPLIETFFEVAREAIQ